MLKETLAQAEALQGALRARLGGTSQGVHRHALLDSDERRNRARGRGLGAGPVVLLPLYPHFSTTTTGSSLKAWRAAYQGPGEVHTVCCYPEEAGLVEAHARSIRATHQALGSPAPVRVLFSAHGLPQKVVDGGDPYESQIQRTWRRSWSGWVPTGRPIGTGGFAIRAASVR